jgi:hypothetical protein
VDAIKHWADNHIRDIKQHLTGLQQNNPTVYALQRRMWEEEIARTHDWVKSEYYWRYQYRAAR